MPSNPFQNLPKNWEVKTLGEVLSNDKYAIKRGPFGSSLKKEFFVDSGIRVFEQYNPINQDSNWKRYFITQQKFKELESFKAGAGDLLISCSGTLGKILELPKNVEVGIINQALLKIRLDNKQILNSYFVHLFNSPYMQNIILENTIGSAIQNIAGVKVLKQIKIPLPPLATQKAIVEKLENAFAHIDEAVRHLRVVQTNIPRLKSSLLHCAFNGKLTESPICHSEGEARRISKDSTLRDISLVSQAQYDTIALTQNQIAFSKYPAFIYIVSNKNNTTLYIGVTSNLQKRIYEHKNHLHKGFSDKYNCEKLVYFESFDNINQAIEREKYLKGKKRAFKENLINAINPKWLDLYGYLFGDISHFSNAQYDKATCHSEALGEVSQEIFRCAQNDKGDNLPQGWEVKTLGEVCEILDNMRKPINADEREQRLKKAENRFPYYGATGQVGYIDDYLCDFEAILLGEDGAPFLESMKNKAYIVSGKYWVNNHAHILKTKENIANNKFICHFLNILDYTPYVSGTTRLKLNQSSMKQIKIPLPPLATQNQIVQILESKFAHLEKLAQFVNASLENLQRLKSSLLNQAFKGELVC